MEDFTSIMGEGGNAYTVIFNRNFDPFREGDVAKAFSYESDRDSAFEYFKLFPNLPFIAGLPRDLSAARFNAPCMKEKDYWSYKKGETCFYLVMKNGGAYTLEQCLDRLGTMENDAFSFTRKEKKMTGRLFCRRSCEQDEVGVASQAKCPNTKTGTPRIPCFFETRTIPRERYLQKIYMELLDMVYDLHKAGWVHGDLQTKNIMLESCSLPTTNDPAAGHVIQIPTIKFVDLDGMRAAETGELSRCLVRDLANLFELNNVCSSGGFSLPVAHGNTSPKFRDFLTLVNEMAIDVIEGGNVCVSDSGTAKQIIESVLVVNQKLQDEMKKLA
jgi:hypothetical protein